MRKNSEISNHSEFYAGYKQLILEHKYELERAVKGLNSMLKDIDDLVARELTLDDREAMDAIETIEYIIPKLEPHINEINELFNIYDFGDWDVSNSPY